MNENLSNLLKNHESEDHEFFETLDEDAVARTVCAFLNAEGGRIVVGATDEGDIVGLKRVQSVDVVDQVLREAVQPSAMWTSTLEETDGGKLLVLDIPKGMTKPYLLKGTIWWRDRSETRPATPDDISRIIEDRIRADGRWERRPALGVTKDDIDLAEVRSAAQEIESKGRHRFKKASDALGVLNELSLYTAEQFTNACVILFGKTPARVFPQAAVRLTVFKGAKKDRGLSLDRLFEGHLFDTMQSVEGLVDRHVTVVSEFQSGDWRREDTPSYPYWSLREGILNGLMHRDLSQPSGGMSVGIYPDRIQVWNSGSLPEGWDAADLRKDHPSVPPNPDIAHVCFLRGWVEKLGRGTQLIAEEFESLGLEVPIWKSSHKGVELTFMSASASRKTATEELSSRQRDLVAGFEPGQEFKVSDYVAAAEGAITDRTARSDLQGLVKAGLVKKRGRGKNTFYVRSQKSL